MSIEEATEAILDLDGDLPAVRTASELELEVAERELANLEMRARLPKTFSVSLIQWTARCMLGAKLSKTHSHSGPEAIVGSAVHEVIAALDMMALVEGRPYIEVDEALQVAERVLATSTDLANDPLSLQGYLTVMEMVSNWAGETTYPDPGDIDLWEVELPVRNYFQGYVLTGRLDKVVIRGTHCDITDYKTGGWMPDEDEVAENHTQLPMYAWHAYQQWPFLRTFTLTEDYLRFGEPRTVHMDMGGLATIEAWMRVAVSKAVTGLSAESPKPLPGDHCAICPNALLCTLPEEDRPASIQTEEDAVALGGELLVLDQRRKKLNGALQAHCKQDDHPGFVLVGHEGKEKKIGYHEGTQNSLNKARLDADIEAGNPKPMSEYYEPKVVRKWDIRNHQPMRGQRAKDD